MCLNKCLRNTWFCTPHTEIEIIEQNSAHCAQLKTRTVQKVSKRTRYLRDKWFRKLWITMAVNDLWSINEWSLTKDYKIYQQQYGVACWSAKQDAWPFSTTVFRNELVSKWQCAQTTIDITIGTFQCVRKLGKVSAQSPLSLPQNYHAERRVRLFLCTVQILSVRPINAASKFETVINLKLKT